MGETRDRLIERLKVPKIWDKEHRVCPRKRCILAVLLYRQSYLNNKRYALVKTGASNGTLVNGKQVKEALLLPGDLLTVGLTSFKVKRPQNKLLAGIW